MFDVHYHLLYGVDDGPENIEESIAMAEASIAEGVTHIVCTPHFNDAYEFRPEANQEALDQIRKHVGNGLTFAQGCEFRLTYEHMDALQANPHQYAINGKCYLLVELSDYGLPPHLEDWFDDIHSFGLIPVLVHPERNPLLQGRADRIREWVSAGALVQLTAGSPLGRFGHHAEKLAKALLDKDMVHLVASDAHGVKSRRPAMKRAHEFLSRKYDPATAERLCLDNPKAVFFGEPLGSPSGLENGSQKGDRRGLLSRILHGGQAESL